MALLVHLAPENALGSIRRAGIRVSKQHTGVYAMPVMPNFVVSHQWLRELRRQRLMFAVYLRIPDHEVVLMGHYNSAHVELTAAKAAREVMYAADPLGMEIIIPRPIVPREIHAIRSLPQVIGWRHYPTAHGRRPCGCLSCQPRGGIRTRRLRDADQA